MALRNLGLRCNSTEVVFLREVHRLEQARNHDDKGRQRDNMKGQAAKDEKSSHPIAKDLYRIEHRDRFGDRYRDEHTRQQQINGNERNERNDENEGNKGILGENEENTLDRKNHEEKLWAERQGFENAAETEVTESMAAETETQTETQAGAQSTAASEFSRFELDPEALALALSLTFAPTLWETATAARPPAEGSMVEFRANGVLCLGAVVAAPTKMFDERANKLRVATVNETVVDVDMGDVTFVAHQVVRLAKADANAHSELNIQLTQGPVQESGQASVPHKVHATQNPREFVGNGCKYRPVFPLVRLFAALADTFRAHAASALRAHYAAVAAPHAATCTSLAVAAAAVEPDPRSLPSYFHQGALLWAVHCAMRADAARWTVPLPPSSNIVWRRCLNTLPPAPIYLANSVATMDAVAALLAALPADCDALDSFLCDLEARPHDAAALFNLWEGRRHRAALTALRHAVVCPHPRLMDRLSKLRVLRKNSATCSSLQPRHVYDLLTRIGVYNSSTDIVLSAGLAGLPREQALAAAKDSDIAPGPVVRSGSSAPPDLFSHLRSATILEVYAVEGAPFAFSLAKISPRRYKLSIHVSDVAAHVEPASALFERWTQTLANYFRVGGGPSPLGAVADNLSLSGRPGERPASRFFRVGDASSTNVLSESTCLTISLDYHTERTDPLADLSLFVNISFDRVGDVRVLSLAELEDRLRPEEHLLAFRLFTRAHTSTSTADKFVANFVNNILERYRTTRNRRCAALADQSMLEKDITFDADTNEPEDRNQELVDEAANLANGVLTDRDGGNCTKDTPKGVHIRSLATPRASRFVRELEILAGSMAGTFCLRESIPVFAEGQELMLTPSDEVYISHNNRLLPNFEANSYYQTILARDAAGNVSPAAYFAGNNYLAPSRLHTSADTVHVPLGLNTGYVDVDASSSIAAYVNQLQLIAFIHASTVAKTPLLTRVAIFSELHARGYPLHGPHTSEVLATHLQSMEDARLGAQYISELRSTFWKLRYVEQTHESYQCIITRAGPVSNGRKLWHAFCEQLALEITVESDHNLAVGSVVTTNDLVHVNAVDGVCIIKQAYSGTT